MIHLCGRLRPGVGVGERLALAAYLTGYRDSTRDAYALDIRRFMA